MEECDGSRNSSCGAEGGLVFWPQQQLGLCIFSLLMTQSSPLKVNSHPPVSPEFQQHHLRDDGYFLPSEFLSLQSPAPCQAPGPKAYEMLPMTGSVSVSESRRRTIFGIPPCGAGPQQGPPAHLREFTPLPSKEGLSPLMEEAFLHPGKSTEVRLSSGSLGSPV